MSRSHHHGAHHQHMRKKSFNNLEPYPHSNKGIFFLDKFVVVLAFIGPLSNLPQIIEIFSSRSAEAVSGWTWGFSFLLAFPWLVYGVVHKELPIILANILWMLADAVVIGGVLIYS